MLTIPMNYTSFGGTYTIATGINAGKQVFGQDPLWLAWVTDLINYKDAGNMSAYKHLLTTVTPARFKVGQMIGATADYVHKSKKQYAELLHIVFFSWINQDILTYDYTSLHIP